jgi:hypothetical protein
VLLNHLRRALEVFELIVGVGERSTHRGFPLPSRAAHQRCRSQKPKCPAVQRNLRESLRHEPEIADELLLQNLPEPPRPEGPFVETHKRDDRCPGPSSSRRADQHRFSRSCYLLLWFRVSAWFGRLADRITGWPAADQPNQTMSGHELAQRGQPGGSQPLGHPRATLAEITKVEQHPAAGLGDTQLLLQNHPPDPAGKVPFGSQ